MKTIERAHMPNKWWQKIKLSTNYATALDQINDQLIYWPKFLVHKCKQRLTRLTQVAVRVRRLEREQRRLGETLVPKLAPKIRRREDTRERKALAAAKVERAIERELIERLRSGAYGENPLNVDENIWKKVLRGLEREGEGERDVDLDEGIEEELENELETEEGVGDIEYVSDIDGESDEDNMEDFEDWSLDSESGEEDEEESGEEAGDGTDKDEGSSEEEDEAEKLKQALNKLKRKRPTAAQPKSNKKSTKSSKSSKGPKREIEYEYETETPAKGLVRA